MTNKPKKYFDTAIAMDSEGNPITIKQVNNWIRNSDKDNLADFFWHRYYGRYLKPFDFDNQEYIDKYKSGFAIMTSCCLLIETYVSFTEPAFKKTTKKSERCFGYFFSTNPTFSVFSTGGMTADEYKNSDEIRKIGIPHDFYKNVRCGLLHNAETRNKWKIVRRATFLFDEETKTINAFRFMGNLKCVIKNFRNELRISNFDDEIWKTYRSRLKMIIDNS